jgi:hypothetical protein
MYTRLDQ